jgi:hypothetical protein
MAMKPNAVMGNRDAPPATKVVSAGMPRDQPTRASKAISRQAQAQQVLHVRLRTYSLANNRSIEKACAQSIFRFATAFQRCNPIEDCLTASNVFRPEGEIG